MLHKRTTNVSRRDALRLAATVAGLGLVSPPAPAFADTNSDLANAQAQLKEAENRLSGIASEYQELSAAQSQTLDDLYDVENKIEEIGKRIVVLEDDLAAKRQELGKSVREEYKDGNHGVVDLILAATTIEELISNIYYFDKVSAEKARLIQSVKDAHEALQKEQAELEVERKNLEEISQEQEAQLEAMRGKQLEAQQVIDGLSKEVRELLEKRDAELLAAQKEAETARKQREEAAAAQKKKEQEQAAASAAGGSNQTKQDAGGDTNKTQESKPADASASKQESAPQPEPEPEPEPEPAPGGSAGRGGNGTGSAAAVVSACYSTPSPGLGLCAGWCSDVMINAGYGFVAGNANDMYAAYCFSSNRADLKPGMAVAVSSHPHTTMGQIYGHIGMYIGNGMMMDNVGYIRTISVDEWCSFYGATVSPRWGWLNGIVLS